MNYKQPTVSSCYYFVLRLRLKGVIRTPVEFETPTSQSQRHQGASRLHAAFFYNILIYNSLKSD